MNNSVQVNVASIIQNKYGFSIALDVATTKGMKQSFLGITVFYMDEKYDSVRFALDVVSLRGSHTGAMIQEVTEETLRGCGLNLKDAAAIVTDGASNMIKAFE